MGILGLLPLLRKLAPAAFLEHGQWERRVPAGSVVMVDVAIFACKYAALDGCVDVGRLTVHFATLARRLREIGWEPRFVFDGGALRLKDAERAKRRAVSDRAAERHRAVGATILREDDARAALAALRASMGLPADAGEDDDDSDEDDSEGAAEAGGDGLRVQHGALVVPAGASPASAADMLAGYPTCDGVAAGTPPARPRTHPVRADYELLRAAMDARGLVTQSAVYEAEARCAYVAARGDAAAVLSNDSDALAYGAPLLVCNYGTGREFAVDYAEVLRATGLTAAAFLDACLLCGTDFNRRVANVGPASVFKLMTAHGSAAAALAWAQALPVNKRRPALAANLCSADARALIVDALPRVRAVFTTFCGEAAPLDNSPIAAAEAPLGAATEADDTGGVGASSSAAGCKRARSSSCDGSIVETIGSAKRPREDCAAQLHAAAIATPHAAAVLQLAGVLPIVAQDGV